tara:strand:+ start:2439 stop:2711 length:273 start_codon:yes stop_codon:yes gene_type:complete
MNIDFIAAAESHYKAKMDAAALTMRVYMNSAVGVGEHPQVFEEFLKCLEDFGDARENFKVVQELKAQFIKAQEAQEEPEDAIRTPKDDED